MRPHAPLSVTSIPAASKSAAEERELRLLECAIGYRILGAHGWGSTGDGHISARDPERADHFWMARYGVPFNLVTVRDLVLVGPTGDVVEAPGGLDTGINRAGFHIHSAVHDARPDVVSACHTHTGYGTPLAARRQLIRPISQESCAFFECHVLFDDEELDVQSTEGGKRIAVALGSHRHAILANHGLLTTGGSVAEAVGWFVTMERVAEVQMKAGDHMRPISDEGARQVARTISHPMSGWAAFQWLARKHVPDLDSVLAG